MCAAPNAGCKRGCSVLLRHQHRSRLGQRGLLRPSKRQALGNHSIPVQSLQKTPFPQADWLLTLMLRALSTKRRPCFCSWSERCLHSPAKPGDLSHWGAARVSTAQTVGCSGRDAHVLPAGSQPGWLRSRRMGMLTGAALPPPAAAYCILQSHSTHAGTIPRRGPCRKAGDKRQGHPHHRRPTGKELECLPFSSQPQSPPAPGSQNSL